MFPSLIFFRFMDLKFLRGAILEMVSRSGQGDFSGSLAVLDVLYALYFGKENGRAVLSFDVKKPQSGSRDRIVVSNGALAPAWYVCLAQAGFFSVDELRYFGQERALLKAYPEVKIPGIEVSVRSPGYGLKHGVALARELQLHKKTNRVVVVLDDADLVCGAVWEAVLEASFERLENLTVICAHAGSARLRPLHDKFEAFGWRVMQVKDGHDVNDVALAVARAAEMKRLPVCIIAPTVLGNGVPFLQGKLEYRGVPLSLQEAEVARHSLS